MPAGRPPLGTGLVDRLEGSEEAKRKLKAVLETVSGESTVAEVCERLGISETRLFQLREEALTSAVERLEPAARGRPAAPEPEEESEVERLEKENQRLRVELELARGRVLASIAFPHLVKDREPEKKKIEASGEKREEKRRLRKAERRNRKRG